MDTNKTTEAIIKCAYKVHNTLGSGFLEKVYENALLIELNKNGLEAIAQAPITVNYDGQIVGQYYADIIVNNVIIELKAVENIVPIHEVQLVNYLKATGIDVGLLINFGSSVEVKRKYKDYKPKSVYTR
jgi:GxxExxY protein